MFFNAEELIQPLLFGILFSQVLAVPIPSNDYSTISKRHDTPFEITMGK